MRREEALRILGSHRAEINAHGVKSLAVFGSVARDEARAGSDVDLLVEFSVPTGLFEFVRLKHYLESILSCTVDLATPRSLHEQMRERIPREAIRAA